MKTMGVGKESLIFMKKWRNHKKGFTLVEILIVIVILAVLASMILPRLTAQPETGYIAEAQNVLGFVRSALVMNIDSAGGTWPTLSNADFQNAATMLSHNLRPVVSTNWSFSCGQTSGGFCMATRLGTGSHAGASIILNQTGSFSCAGTNPYTLIDAAKGCKS